MTIKQINTWEPQSILYGEFASNTATTHFLWNSVNSIAIEIKPRNGGSSNGGVDISEIQTISNTLSACATLIIDDCNKAITSNSTNNLGCSMMQQGWGVITLVEAGDKTYRQIVPTSNGGGFYDFLRNDKGDEYYVPTIYSHVAFSFCLLATYSGDIAEAFKVELKDEGEHGLDQGLFIFSNFNYIVEPKITALSEITPGIWYKVEIPIDDFYDNSGGTIQMNKLKIFTIMGVNGTRYGVDDLKFCYSRTNSGSLANCWLPVHSDNASLAVSRLDNSWSLNYNFSPAATTDDYVNLMKTSYFNLVAGGENAFQIKFKSSTNTVNSLFNLRFYDYQGTVMDYVFPIPKEATNDWQTRIIFFSQMQAPQGAFEKQAVRQMQINLNGLADQYSELELNQVQTIKAVQELPATANKGYARPNPFLPARGEITQFYLPPDDYNQGFKIKIMNLNGKLMRSLNNINQWDGRNEAGRVCEGGVYIYQIEGNHQILNGQVVLIK
jgi:hypothetical protein